VVKYLSANVEDAFGSVITSVKLGGSVAFAIIGNAVLIPVALVLPADGLGPFCGPGA
jgi:hypothetical protein